MKKRINPFDGLVYDGDWHSRLLVALKLAKEDATSTELQNAIVEFERVLVKHDECLQTVTAFRLLPLGIEPDFVVECTTSTSYGEVADVSLTGNGSIALTLTMRGSLNHVEHRAASLMERGIAAARVILAEPHPSRCN